MIYDIAPTIKGYLTPSDLLHSAGVIEFQIEKNQVELGGYFFIIQGEGFIFNLRFQELKMIVNRNETVALLTLEKVPDETKLVLSVVWSYSELTLICKFGKNVLKSVVPTRPITPPYSLLKWARLKNLIPTKEYENAEEFRNKIHSCLITINEKIEESGSYHPFWNFNYEKGKIINREPKNEIEVQPVIQCLLSDQMLISSIEIIPEFKGGVGNLDFLFIGQIKNQGASYFCAEFKNAHSDKLFDGLTKQLPAYMKNKKADYGAYCVLNYFGEWLETPNKLGNIDYNLRKTRISMQNQFMNKIRVFSFKLSKPISASKL